jgi:hypothetical protein
MYQGYLVEYPLFIYFQTICICVEHFETLKLWSQAYKFMDMMLNFQLYIIFDMQLVICDVLTNYAW